MYKIQFKLTGFEFKPDYFTKLLGFIHKCLGKNDLHNDISLYSYSHIHNNSFTFVSYNINVIDKIVKGAMFYKKMFDNCEVVSFKLIHIIYQKNVFKCASPFFVKDSENKHLIFKEAELQVKSTLIKKAARANIDLSDFDIEFINFEKTKLIKIHEINNKCFVSSVKIHGNDTVKSFACQVGLGNSTGCGFGFIY